MINLEKPAILGGKPTRETVLPLFDVDIGEEEANNVLSVLKSRDLVQTHGTWANNFGKLAREYLGSKHIVMANNGTSTIHLALIALGVEPGNEVICSPLGWISSGTPSLYQNAIPIYADVDPIYGFIDVEDVRKKITPRTKAICVVHPWGLPADMDPLLELGEEKDIPIVEDAAEALGATYKGKKVGLFGAFGSFSTVWNKIITTGEGGFLVTNDEELANTAGHYASFAKVPGKGDYFDGLGYNYRMTEMMGALGVAQIKRVDSIIEKRRANADYLLKHLSSLDIQGLNLLHEPKWGRGVWWKFTVLLDLEKFTVTRDEILRAIQAEGIGVAAPVYPDNLQPFYESKRVYGNTDCPWGCHYYKGPKNIDYSKMCPEAKIYSDRALWLTGCGPRLTTPDLESIVDAVDKILNYYKK